MIVFSTKQFGSLEAPVKKGEKNRKSLICASIYHPGRPGLSTNTTSLQMPSLLLQVTFSGEQKCYRRKVSLVFPHFVGCNYPKMLEIKPIFSSPTLDASLIFCSLSTGISNLASRRKFVIQYIMYVSQLNFSSLPPPPSPG